MNGKPETYVSEVTGAKRDELRMASMPYRQLPEEGFVRLQQIIGDRKADPPIPPLIPVGKSTWWAGVKSGRYPPSVKLGPRTTAWRVEAIRALIATATAEVQV